MKAIIYQKYGAPDVFQLKEVPMPVPKKYEVLVKVHAASINSWDWDLQTGKPYIYRLMFGLFKPKYPIIGSDIAGTVVAVGDEVTQFQTGDEVYGDISEVGFGAFAEYACAPERLLVPIPKEMSFEEAAAIPQAGLLAFQGLQYNGGVKPGQKVLINGGGGGVGSLGIQMAKHYGAEVAGVDHAGKQEFMRHAGADHVIDFLQEDFTRNGQQYDLILDNKLARSAADCSRALKPGGAYAVLGGKVSLLLRMQFIGRYFVKGKKVGLMMFQPNQKDLNAISALYEQGAVKPVVDKTFALADAAEAMRYFGEGTFVGKIVLKVIE